MLIQQNIKNNQPDLYVLPCSIDSNKLIQSANEPTFKVNILPAQNPVEKKELAKEHSAEPIKSTDDLKRIISYFLDNGKYRNAMLFITGICTGLRVSDLRELRFNDFINDDCTFKNELIVFEHKTRNTRKQAKNRRIYINQNVKHIIAIYLQHYQRSLDDYLFISESNNGSCKPLTPRAIDDILKDVTKKLNINIRVSTHTLRKTFAYHTIMQAKDKSRAIQQLQLLLGHSSQLCTLKYAGITDDELAQTYKELYFNLDDVL